MVYKLVLVRHGESDWNQKNLFTGWVDCDLSAKGLDEAHRAGALVRDNNLAPTVAYTSVLQRATKTCDIILQEANCTSIPVVRSWRLNERMYGALQGLNKAETTAKYGEEQVLIWRRSYSTPPPEIELGSKYDPRNDALYADLEPSLIPRAECLLDTVNRCMPFWNETIVPALRAGNTVLVAAHGNSLRGIIKHLDNIPDDVIPGVEIPTGIPLYYELDDALQPIAQPGAVAPLSGVYLGDAAAVAAAQEKVRSQIKSA